MTLFRSYPANVRIGTDELDGLLRILDARIDAMLADGEADAALYEGARIALSIIGRHERIEYPIDFLSLFELYLREGDDE